MDLDLKESITITISLIALFISLINWIRDWKRVSVDIQKKTIIKRVETYDCVPAYPGQNYGVGVEFRFLNSSKYSMGYFDIVFRDGYTNEILPSFFTYALRPEIAEQELLGIMIDDSVIHLNPMKTNYGMVDANSYKLHESIVYPVSDKIRVNIKFAKFSPFFNFRSTTKRFCKWKSVVLKLTEEEIFIFQKLTEEQLTKQPQQ